MDTKEAAKELGISSRSLQRAVSNKKLNVSYQRGKSGKMEASYDPDDIARYKAELAEVIKPAESNGQDKALVPTTRDIELAQVVGQELAQAIGQLLRDAVEARDKAAQLVPVEHKLIVSLVEAAALSGVSKADLLDAIHSNALKARKRRGWRIKRAELDAYVKKL
jgi:excisionase family DNA binding protein